ncbi:COP9 signalosome complex subunit 5 [Ceratocystis lukuohia]|uniref:COP9 signalosome complex subunit 5 n=1 Tax=Ceratocystis lukuohia TaxID=2019550 RepID=A0ABR4MT42_9PEZI
MHHRVSSFFRSSTETISAKARGLQSQLHKPQSQTQTQTRSQQSAPRQRQASYASSNASTDCVSVTDSSESVVPGNNNAATISTLTTTANKKPTKSSARFRTPAKKNLISFNFSRGSRSILAEPAAGTLDCTIESPPAVLYGPAEDSSGALVSGLMRLTVHEPQLDIDSFEAYFNLTITQKKPYHSHCLDCASTTTELKRWTFFNEHKTLSQGVHEFPFSVLIEGHLPASTNAQLIKVSYDLKAAAILSSSQPSLSISTKPIKFERTLEVKRSIIRPDGNHRSLRVFPPTEIKAEAHYSQYIYPTATNTLSLRMEGVTVRNEATQTLEYWKLRRATWRLEESVKSVAQACEKHATTSADGNSKTSILRDYTRVIGHKNMTEGWKTDYATDTGRIELDFEYGTVQPKPNSNSPIRYATDLKTAEGIEISHCLMLELVVSREWAPINRPELITHTGTGRILRMRYPVFLTESPGLGISWDNEAPPMYQDVPASPPSYPKNVLMPLVSYAELEDLESYSASDASTPNGSEIGGSSRSSCASSISNGSVSP